MSDRIKKRLSNQTAWLYSSIFAAMLPWLGNFLTALLYPVNADHRVEIRQAAGIVLLLSVVALIVAMIALFKVKGRKKLIVLTATISTIFIGYVALFSYMWLGQ